VAHAYEAIANARKDFLHKLTTRLVRENQTIVVEDLAVKNMQKTTALACLLVMQVGAYWFSSLNINASGMAGN
jgi:transposase